MCSVYLLALALSAQEDLLPSAPARIQKIRTRSVTLRVQDRDGKPRAGRFRAEMIRHQFLFGCNLYMFEKMPGAEQNQRYLELWSSLFNYATVPFYFAQYEPSPGKTMETEVKKMTAWCRQHGVKVKGHPLIWHFPAGNPEWLPKDLDAVEAVNQARIKDLVEKFKPDIQYWDVLNEPTVAWMYDTPIAQWENRIGPLAAAAKGLAWAAQADPEATLLVNDYNVKLGLWSALDILHPVRSLRSALDPVPHYKYSYYRFLSELKARGGRYNAVGIQTHMHMGGVWTMADLWGTCDRYSGLGLPLHFTEVTVLSGKEKIMWPFNPEVNLPWPTTPEGEAAQAEYVEKFYTLLFSHPAVEAITWWDFTDRDAWMGAPAGLVREDLSLKPAYSRLLRLIHEQWWTDVTADTDAQGRLSFRGFCGDYLLHLEDGGAASFSIDCRRQEGQAIAILL